MDNFDPKKYFEAENQKKVLYVPNLSTYLNSLHHQILKLPHEVQAEYENIATGGTKYEDIVKSVINGVSLAYDMCIPYVLTHGPDVEEDIGPPNINPKTLEEARELLRWIYVLLDKANALNDKMIEIELPDEEEEDKLEEANEQTDESNLSADKHETMGDKQEMGNMEKKDV